MNILHIDSSILGANSVSRLLSAEIVARETTLHPGSAVVYRDLGEHPIGFLTSAHMAAFQGSPVTDTALEADLADGAKAIDELFAADVIVIGVPMYNFSIPAQLKAWIDRVVVAGKTFQYGASGPEGLLPKGKKVFIASARGGIYSGDSAFAPYDHQEKQLVGVLGFIGLTDVTVIRAEGISMGAEVKESALAQARTEIAAIAA